MPFDNDLTLASERATLSTNQDRHQLQAVDAVCQAERLRLRIMLRRANDDRAQADQMREAARSTREWLSTL